MTRGYDIYFDSRAPDCVGLRVLRGNQGTTQASAEGSDAYANGHEKVASLGRGGDELTSEDTVAFSGRLIAASRAIESRREDRLFNDVFAERLVRQLQTVRSP